MKTFKQYFNYKILLESINTPNLSQEAKKYRTAEEFVEAQGIPLYHGTSNADKISEGGFSGDEIHLTDSKIVADSYQKWNKGKSPGTIEVYAKIENPAYFDAGGKKYTDHKENFGYKIGQAVYDAKKRGHDSLIVKNIRDNFDSSIPTDAHNTYIVFSPDQIKTKAQLTEIWNKAHYNENI